MPISPSCDAPALSLRNLSAGFPDGRGGRVEVIRIDALDLGPGARLCITGPSGSGKSTLLNLLSGLLLPDAGSVTWGGTDLTRLGPAARDAWRRRAGFVFQDFHLIPELSPLANVLLPVSFGRVRVPAEMVARARALLARFGAPEGRRRAADLSRGEQQRVALARALILDPPVILADEPTASLDAATAAEVAGALAGLQEDEGRTVIAVSHDPGLIARFGNPVTLAHGRISAGAFGVAG